MMASFIVVDFSCRHCCAIVVAVIVVVGSSFVVCVFVAIVVVFVGCGIVFCCLCVVLVDVIIVVAIVVEGSSPVVCIVRGYRATIQLLQIRAIISRHVPSLLHSSTTQQSCPIL